MVKDANLLAELSQATKDLRPRGLEPSEVAEKWQNLIAMLHQRVSQVPALPSEEPASTDAGFCLFVHSQLIRDMQASPKWPVAVAKRLGITSNDNV